MTHPRSALFLSTILALSSLSSAMAETATHSGKAAEQKGSQMDALDRNLTLLKRSWHHTTSTGALFTKGSDGWVIAPDGSKWSRNLGLFSNDGSISVARSESGKFEGTVADSAAVRACLQIPGASLPTREQYTQLKEYFEVDTIGSQPMFTEQGAKDFLKVFPDAQDKKGNSHLFWTSTVFPFFARAYSTGVFSFYAGAGNIGGSENDYKASVRCVIAAE